MAVRNPWINLAESPPYVTPPDRGAVVAYNVEAKPDQRLQTELLPEPFVGSPDAPIVLLSRNPGFKTEDLVELSTPKRMAAMRGSLRHKPATLPFYYLDPLFEGTGGDRYWSSKLKAPLEVADRDTVASRVLCIEWLGYKSTTLNWRGPLLPSQHYGFYLARRALDRDAVVVFMTAKRLWLDCVPELAEYPNVFEVRNWRNPAISQRNCPEGWDEIERRLA